MHLSQSLVCLALLCAVGAAARPLSPPGEILATQDFGNVVFRGYQALAGAGTSFTNSNFYISSETECIVFCNGKSLNSTECIGRTKINCLTILPPDDKNETRVDLYTRTCEGQFVNVTRESWEKFDTSQACRGISMMTMRSERRIAEDWVTDFTYRKTCSTRFIMTVIKHTYRKASRPDETEVVTLCEGASAAFVDSDLSPFGSELPMGNAKKKQKNTAECNGKKSVWDAPCKGLFEAVEWVEEVKCTTTCVGEWTPYMVNWECHGEYNFTRYEQQGNGFNARHRGCSGATVISASDYEVGYQLCNGESRFNERYTLPLVEAV